MVSFPILSGFGPRRTRFPELLVKFRERWGCVLYDGGARSGGSRRRADGVGVSWDAYPVPSVAAVAAPSVARHAVDAAPARRRGGVNSSPLDRARTAAFSSREDLVKHCRVPATHWLISTQASQLCRIRS